MFTGLQWGKPLPMKVFEFMQKHPDTAFTDIDVANTFDISLCRTRWVLERLLEEGRVVMVQAVGGDSAYVISTKDLSPQG
jgi:hypothetical protein